MDLIKKYKLFFALLNTGFIGNLLVIYYLSKASRINRVPFYSAVKIFLSFNPSNIKPFWD